MSVKTKSAPPPDLSASDLAASLDRAVVMASNAGLEGKEAERGGEQKGWLVGCGRVARARGEGRGGEGDTYGLRESCWLAGGCGWSGVRPEMGCDAMRSDEMRSVVVR